MSRKTVSLEVPITVREPLFPYAGLFESVLIPAARRMSFASFGRPEGDRLEKEIRLHLAEMGFRPHHVLIYVGLMLCCRYAEQECFEAHDRKMKQRNLNLIARAKSLVCLVYQDCAIESYAYLI